MASRVSRVDFLTAICCALIFLSGCISAPPKKPNLVEQLKQENEVGSRLARNFEAKLRFRSDPVVDRYLKKLGDLIEKKSGDPRLANTEIAMVQDRNSIWRSYSLPGKRVYLSIGLLQRMKTDSEVAALIAIELGHIQQKHVLNHLAPAPNPSQTPVVDPKLLEADPKKIPEFFGDKGLFTYNEKELGEALASAVGLLYKAGIDSRAVTSVMSLLEKNPEHTALPASLLLSLVQTARDDVDTYPPLIDPIVRTQEFSVIRKRIQNL